MDRCGLPFVQLSEKHPLLISQMASLRTNERVSSFPIPLPTRPSLETSLHILASLIFYAVRNVRSETRSPKPYLKITSRRSARRKERARTIASFIRPLRRIRRTCVAGAAPLRILHARRSKGGEGGGVPESKFDPP